ncbi:unnamed protein product [Vicia faba]|uniref:Uncharacterized protein n=1 Tax=Vicia faba TaxID=3906 RepID=A0AAV1B8J5_VICFA|nr:unnamed protein product [Vicia faba]
MPLSVTQIVHSIFNLVSLTFSSQLLFLHSIITNHGYSIINKIHEHLHILNVQIKQTTKHPSLHLALTNQQTHFPLHIPLRQSSDLLTLSAPPTAHTNTTTTAATHRILSPQHAIHHQFSASAISGDNIQLPSSLHFLKNPSHLSFRLFFYNTEQQQLTFVQHFNFPSGSSTPISIAYSHCTDQHQLVQPPLLR